MDVPRSFAWRPHTTIILLSGFAVVLLAIITSFALNNFKPSTEVRIGSGVYQLWLATTNSSRINGLSGVESLKANQGLLMVYPDDALHGIWMKDMKVPLDILWLDSDKKVIYIVTNAAPELSTSKTFRPNDPARYVIELPAGAVKKAGIKTGQTADFRVEGTTL